MKRIVYYVINCSSQENQEGTFHYSEPFKTKREAINYAKTIKDDNVGIEKHHEIYYRWNWEVDHEGFNNAIQMVDY